MIKWPEGISDGHECAVLLEGSSFFTHGSTGELANLI